MKIRYITLFSAILGFVTALSFFTGSSLGAEQAKKLVVSEGKTVKISYTLTVDGKEVDSSKERGPLQFKPGNHEMITGFEKAVMGMKVGQKKSFNVSPQEGYGPENPKAFHSVPKNQLPPDIKPKAGMTLYAKGKNGQPIPIRIKEVKKDVVVMNLNHPLAGKTLHFDVEIVDIQ